MIDKTNPEIQIYLKEELQKQREQILERIIWRNRYFPIFNSTYENLEYYTGASMEKIEEIIEKCQWKARYQRTYDRTRLLARVGCAWYLIKMQQLDDDLKAVKNGIVIEALKEWRKDPDKYAVMELVCHNIPEEYIVNELDLTYDKLRELYPTDEELKKYQPAFTEEELSDEKLEEAYQKMIKEENSKQ